MKNINEKLLETSKEGGANKVKKLLSGADIETIGERDRTPLIIACIHDRTKIVKLLLDMGANPNAKDEFDDTALLWVSNKGNTELVKLLLEYGADVNAREKHGCTPLLWASINKHPETVNLLIERGADINVHIKGYGSCLDHKCKGVWKKKDTQKHIINKQSHNIKLFDDKIGILPSLKEKYKEMIELSQIGLF